MPNDRRRVAIVAITFTETEPATSQYTDANGWYNAYGLQDLLTWGFTNDESPHNDTCIRAVEVLMLQDQGDA